MLRLVEAVGFGTPNRDFVVYQLDNRVREDWRAVRSKKHAALVLDYVRRNPGARAEAAARELRIDPKTFTRHAFAHKRAGRLVHENVYLGGWFDAREWPNKFARRWMMASDSVQLIVGMVHERGVVRMHDVVLKMSYSSASSAVDVLQTGVRWGFLERSGRMRTARWRLAPEFAEWTQQAFIRGE